MIGGEGRGGREGKEDIFNILFIGLGWLAKCFPVLQVSWPSKKNETDCNCTRKKRKNFPNQSGN